MYLNVRINEKSINDTYRIMILITNAVFGLQRNFMDQRYKLIHSRTRARTMVATGQTLSRLFYRTKMASSLMAHFECGYDPTDNNQSYHQEFSSGPVHRTKKEHFTDSGEPKCSRKPVDIYSIIGYTTPNRRARRRALGSAIEDSFGVNAGPGVVATGATISYQPDLSSVVNQLRTITRAITRNV